MPAGPPWETPVFFCASLGSLPPLSGRAVPGTGRPGRTGEERRGDKVQATLALATAKREAANAAADASFLHAQPPDAKRRRGEPAEGDSLAELLGQLLEEAELEEVLNQWQDDAGEPDDGAGDALGGPAPADAETDSSAADAGELELERRAGEAEPDEEDPAPSAARARRGELFGAFVPADLPTLEAEVGFRGVLHESGARRDIYDVFAPRAQVGFCRLAEWNTAVVTRCFQGHGGCALTLRSRLRAGLTLNAVELQGVSWLAAGAGRTAAEHQELARRLGDQARER